MFSVFRGKKIILHSPISAACDKTEDILLACSACKHPVTSTVAATLKCDKDCLLFSFTKITVLLLLSKPEEKKNPSLQSFYLLKSYANDKGNYVNYREWKTCIHLLGAENEGNEYSKQREVPLSEAKRLQPNWMNCLLAASSNWILLLGVTRSLAN